jgi:hypothetical protein
VREIVGCSTAMPLAMAQSKGLIDADNMLHCWRCKEVCDWHVSLHCEPCRLAVTERQRERGGATR